MCVKCAFKAQHDFNSDLSDKVEYYRIEIGKLHCCSTKNYKKKKIKIITRKIQLNLYKLNKQEQEQYSATFVVKESLSVPTWHVSRGWEPGGRAWPCSMRYCSHSASGSEPWPHGSGSCHSRGYAMRTKTKTTGVDMATIFAQEIIQRGTRTHIYHSVLILLWSIMHGCVPSIGAAGIDFAYVQHPVPSIQERDM